MFFLLFFPLVFFFFFPCESATGARYYRHPPPERLPERVPEQPRRRDDFDTQRDRGEHGESKMKLNSKLNSDVYSFIHNCIH